MPFCMSHKSDCPFLQKKYTYEFRVITLMLWANLGHLAMLILSLPINEHVFFTDVLQSSLISFNIIL